MQDIVSICETEGTESKNTGLLCEGGYLLGLSVCNSIFTSHLLWKEKRKKNLDLFLYLDNVKFYRHFSLTIEKMGLIYKLNEPGYT